MICNECEKINLNNVVASAPYTVVRDANGCYRLVASTQQVSSPPFSVVQDASLNASVSGELNHTLTIGVKHALGGGTQTLPSGIALNVDTLPSATGVLSGIVVSTSGNPDGSLITPQNLVGVLCGDIKDCVAPMAFPWASYNSTTKTLTLVPSPDAGNIFQLDSNGKPFVATPTVHPALTLTQNAGSVGLDVTGQVLNIPPTHPALTATNNAAPFAFNAGAQTLNVPRPTSITVAGNDYTFNVGDGSTPVTLTLHPALVSTNNAAPYSFNQTTQTLNIPRSPTLVGAGNTYTFNAGDGTTSTVFTLHPALTLTQNAGSVSLDAANQILNIPPAAAGLTCEDVQDCVAPMFGALMTYNDAAGTLTLVPSPNAGNALFLDGSGRPFVPASASSSFTLTGDTGTPQTVSSGDTVTISGKANKKIKTTALATDKIEIEIDTTGATTGQALTFDGTNPVWSTISGGTPADSSLCESPSSLIGKNSSGVQKNFPISIMPKTVYWHTAGGNSFFTNVELYEPAGWNVPAGGWTVHTSSIESWTNNDPCRTATFSFYQVGEYSLVLPANTPYQLHVFAWAKIGSSPTLSNPVTGASPDAIGQAIVYRNTSGESSATLIGKNFSEQLRDFSVGPGQTIYYAVGHASNAIGGAYDNGLLYTGMRPREVYYSV